MRSKTLLTLSIIMLVGLISIIPTNQVFACSGGPGPTFKEIIADTSTIVRAHVVRADGIRQNGIIEVESYLKGGNGESQLVFSQNHPTTIAGLDVYALGGGDCNYLRERLPEDEDTSIYLFLERNLVGSYENRFGGVFVFSDENPTYNFHVEDNNQNIIVPFNEEQFLQFIVDVTEETPTLPSIETAPLRLSPLLITTDTDQHYVLPLDNLTPTLISPDDYLSIVYGWTMHSRYTSELLDYGECTALDCITSAPDKLTAARQVDENTINIYRVGEVNGQGFLFSATSDSIAVWNNDIITIYRNIEDNNYIHWNWDEFNTLQINLGDSEDYAELAGVGAWNPDGRVLAFGDAEGLWLWDIYLPESEPRLLIPIDDGQIIYPRYFSPSGHYLAVTHDDATYTIDIVTETQLPDGIFSGDEIFFTQYDTSSEIFGITICLTLPFDCREPTDSILTQFTWFDVFGFSLPVASYITTSCPSDNLSSCYVSNSIGIGHGVEIGETINGYFHAYKPGNLAIITNPTGLWVNGEAIDLVDVVDGEIVHIEWMRSEFYYRP